MVTSNELLEFIDKCTESEVTLDHAGDVLATEPALLEGKSLATAIAAVASLVVAERDALLQNKSLDLHHLDKAGKPDKNQGYM